MSYTLVPKNDGVPIFMANNLAYGCLLASTDELCGETLNGIRIRPPEGIPDYRLNTWFINDHQQVEAGDASDLGLALKEAIARGEAKECIADKYFARAAEARPGSAEAEKEITKLESMLQEFAGFLVRSGGFEIW